MFDCRVIVFVVFIFFQAAAMGQNNEENSNPELTEKEQIEAALNGYIYGTEWNDPDKILEAFYPPSDMFLYNTADTVMKMSPAKYASLYDNGRKGQRNARYTTIVSLDVQRDIAYAKLEVLIPYWGNRYHDLMLLKKIDGKWLIVAKCATAEPIPKTAIEAKIKPQKEVIISGLKNPWSMAFINEQEAIVAEKDGDLVHISFSTKNKTTINGLPTDVGRAILIDTSIHEKGVYPNGAHGKMNAFNAGWFQILLDPEFSTNKYIYLSYASMDAEKASALKVIRGKLENHQLTEVETILFAGPYSHGLFHFGGGMTFGQDGKLYIATGERNFFEYSNPALPYAQDPQDMRGKVFRINSDGSFPSDNPDFGTSAVSGLYAMGIRATQGMFLDQSTGDIYFTDHGTIQGDEFNKLSAGANYGWPYKTTGRYRSRDYAPKMAPGIVFTPPVHYWDQTIAPTGLTMYRGQSLYQWTGNFIVPGLSKGSLWRLEMEGSEIISTEELFINDRVRLRKAVVSPRGKLYILTDEADGKIIQIVDANR